MKHDALITQCIEDSGKEARASAVFYAYLITRGGARFRTSSVGQLKRDTQWRNYVKKDGNDKENVSSDARNCANAMGCVSPDRELARRVITMLYFCTGGPSSRASLHEIFTRTELSGCSL